jgi:hypothetical protein
VAHPRDPGAAARKPEIDERVGSSPVDRRPRIQDVGLGRADTVRLDPEVPASRLVLLAPTRERRVLLVLVRVVNDAAGRLHGLPVDERRGVVLVSVGALKLATRQRIGRRRQLCRECSRGTQNAECECEEKRVPSLATHEENVAAREGGVD